MHNQKQTGDSMKGPVGAGGTPGGVRDFLVGIAMMAIGFYVLLSKITVVSGFMSGATLYRLGSAQGLPFQLQVTSGTIFIPMIFGIVMIFYNGKSVLGWLLFALSVFAMIAGVITSLSIRMQSMSAVDAIIIFVMAFGGLGVFLRSLKGHS